MPRASGRPYEVMVVMSDKDWQATQGRALFAVLDTDIPGLPQPERSFHISQVEPKRFDSILNIFRNIILVDINKQIYTKTSMKFMRDKYAIDQIVLTIQSPTPEDFADFCFEHGQDIIDFLTKMEMNRLIKELKDKYSKKTAEHMLTSITSSVCTPNRTTLTTTAGHRAISTSSMMRRTLEFACVCGEELRM